jgi:putative polyhydroxyalkanoate system protein
MSTIRIHAIHQLNHEDALEAADELAIDLAEKFDIDYGWDEEVIYFERPGVHGTIRVGEHEILIAARLDLLMIMLKDRIEHEIRRYLQSHFGCTFTSDY